MSLYATTACRCCGRECLCLGDVYSRASTEVDESSQPDGVRMLGLESAYPRLRGGSSSESFARRSGPFYHQPPSGSSRQGEELQSGMTSPHDNSQRGRVHIGSTDVQTAVPTTDIASPSDAGVQMIPLPTGSGTSSAPNRTSRIPWFSESIRQRFSRLLSRVGKKTGRVAKKIKEQAVHHTGFRKSTRRDTPSAHQSTASPRGVDTRASASRDDRSAPTVDLATYSCPRCGKEFTLDQAELSKSQEARATPCCRAGSVSSSLEHMGSPTPEHSSEPGSLKSRPDTPLEYKYAHGGQSSLAALSDHRRSQMSLGDRDSQAPTEVEGLGRRDDDAGHETWYDDTTARQDFAERG